MYDTQKNSNQRKTDISSSDFILLFIFLTLLSRQSVRELSLFSKHIIFIFFIKSCITLGLERSFLNTRNFFCSNKAKYYPINIKTLLLFILSLIVSAFPFFSSPFPFLKHFNSISLFHLHILTLQARITVSNTICPWCWP